MDLSIIKSEITVERAAALYAQIKINEIEQKIFISEQKIKELNKFRRDANKELLLKTWQESKYFEHFTLFFPEAQYSLDFHLSFDEDTQKTTGLNSIYNLEMMLSTKMDFSNVKVEVVARPLEKNNNLRPIMNLPIGSVQLIDREDSSVIIEENINLRKERSQDWVKTYTNNITALQMAKVGMVDTLQVPVLPEIVLNPQLKA